MVKREMTERENWNDFSKWIPILKKAFIYNFTCRRKGIHFTALKILCKQHSQSNYTCFSFSLLSSCCRSTHCHMQYSITKGMWWRDASMLPQFTTSVTAFASKQSLNVCLLNFNFLKLIKDFQASGAEW